VKKRVTRHKLTAAVSGDTQRRVKAAAAAELISASAWLRRVTIRALACQPSAPEHTASDELSADLRDRRLCVRVSPDDALLLKDRALARGMRPATYVSVLLRSHLRSLAPLPKDELLELRRAVSELGALTRDLHRIAHTLAQEGRAAAKGQPDLQAVVRLCQALRSDTKALIQANVNSWEIGRPVNGAASRHPTRQ
jgi:hypothetical protein